MAESPEEIHKSIKKILWVGGLLTFFTAATVGLSYVELPTHSLNIIVGMILATIKAALVALIFMHLNHEKVIIYKFLFFTFAFVLALFLLFYFSSSDPLVFSQF
ncbi:MAG: cytochrome C oxidase subunit IV family protein [Prosthecobacter sp.]